MTDYEGDIISFETPNLPPYLDCEFNSSANALIFKFTRTLIKETDGGEEIKSVVIILSDDSGNSNTRKLKYVIDYQIGDLNV